jgi:hypothetical protein
VEELGLTLGLIEDEGLTELLGDSLLLGDDDPDGEIDCDALGLRLGLMENDGLAEAEGETEVEPDLLGEGEVLIDAEGEGEIEGDPAVQSSGASTTANATRAVSSVCHAISTSSLLSMTRRRKHSQRRFVSVGGVEVRVSSSSGPTGREDSIRRS